MDNPLNDIFGKKSIEDGHPLSLPKDYYCSPENNNNYEFWKNEVSKGLFVRYVPWKFKTEEVCRKAVEVNGFSEIQWVPGQLPWGERIRREYKGPGKNYIPPNPAHPKYVRCEEFFKNLTSGK